MSETTRTTEQEMTRERKEIQERQSQTAKGWRKRQIQDKMDKASKEDGND